ncbi:hypothetical protein GKC56_07120 [Neisseriaceae bacterium PsAf]|nr:hypothetical protein [Neisseriaceae bacterium PsAf]MCV2503801.1 hypothetical protein [Neisseriaceae bacterium]
MKKIFLYGLLVMLVSSCASSGSPVSKSPCACDFEYINRNDASIAS